MRPRSLVVLPSLLLALGACARGDDTTPAAQTAAAAAAIQQGQAAVHDSESTPDVVKVAVGSKDHTTLVAALQAADLVNSLANAGPFTVFAPTNAAFAKLPKGTVESLLAPAQKQRLAGILQHHVAVPVIDVESLADGQEIGVADGGRVKVSHQGDVSFVNGAKILATVRASNGVVYVIDGVLTP